MSRRHRGRDVPAVHLPLPDIRSSAARAEETASPPVKAGCAARSSVARADAYPADEVGGLPPLPPSGCPLVCRPGRGNHVPVVLRAPVRRPGQGRVRRLLLRRPRKCTWLSIRTAHPPPLTKMSSRHPKGVRGLFFDEKLNLFKANFRLYGIKLQIDGNHHYYFSYFATFSLLFQKLLGSLVNTLIC